MVFNQLMLPLNFVVNTLWYENMNVIVKFLDKESSKLDLWLFYVLLCVHFTRCSLLDAVFLYLYI